VLIGNVCNNFGVSCCFQFGYLFSYLVDSIMLILRIKITLKLDFAAIMLIFIPEESVNYSVNRTS